MSDPTASLLWGSLHVVSPLVLLWLAFFFGRTLWRGATPLIEQIARLGNPALSQPLCRYTRRLTAVWCAYFLIAAAAMAVGDASGAGAYGRLSLAIWCGTLVLFVGERWLRPWLFPGESFPSLRQQLRDTWSLWRRQRGTGSDARR